MTMTADLAAFLCARLDEDDQYARGPWGDSGYSEYNEPGAPGHHERVLAEVAAKRRILAEHAPDRGDCRVCAGAEVSSDDVDGDRDWSRSALLYPCQTLRLLALPYAAHPDYQPAWAPGEEG